MYKWHHVSSTAFPCVPALVFGGWSSRTRFALSYISNQQSVEVESVPSWDSEFFYWNAWIFLSGLPTRAARLCNNGVGAVGKLSRCGKGRVWPGTFSSGAGLDGSGGRLKPPIPVLGLQRCLWESLRDPATPQKQSHPADRSQFSCPRSFQDWLFEKSQSPSPSPVIQQQHFKFSLCLKPTQLSNSRWGRGRDRYRIWKLWLLSWIPWSVYGSQRQQVYCS